MEKLGKSKFGFKRTAVSNFKSKRHVGSRNEIVDYTRSPCLGTGQNTRGLWGSRNEIACFAAPSLVRGQFNKEIILVVFTYVIYSCKVRLVNSRIIFNKSFFYTGTYTCNRKSGYKCKFKIVALHL